MLSAAYAVTLSRASQVALEGALKTKEISYIHAEGLAQAASQICADSEKKLPLLAYQNLEESDSA